MRTIFILWLYITRKYLYYLLIVISMLTAIIFVVDYVELVRRFAGQDVLQSDLLAIGIYKLPYYIHLIIPFVVLIATITCYCKMRDANEIIAANSSGVSIWYIIFPIIFTSLVIGIFHITIFNQLMTISFKKHIDLSNKYVVGAETEVSFSDRGVWLKDVENGQLNKIIFAKTLYDRGKILSEVTIYQSPFNREYSSVLVADIASFYNNQVKLEDVTIYSKKYSKPIKKSEHYIHTNISIDKINNSVALPETISLFQLPSFIRNMEKTGFISNTHKMYFYNLLMLPISLVCYVLIAISISTFLKNYNKSEIVIFIAIIFSFITYSIIKILIVTIQNSTNNVVLASILPILFFYLLSIALILHHEDG